MTSKTAASMASSINNTLTAEDLDENRKLAFAVTKTGKLISRSITSFSIAEEEAVAVSEALQKSAPYAEATIKIEYANWFNLDWKVIPWVCPLGQEEAWSDTNSWEQFCVQSGLNPEDHIKRAAYECHNDKVSLLLWNLRKAV